MTRLWDDEIDALRPAIGGEAEEFIAGFRLGESWDESAPEADRVASSRAGQQATEAVSDLAVDVSFEGPAGPLRLRTFRPEGTPRAVMLHIHGGGWFLGRPEMTDAINELICTTQEIAVVSVDYRLAPEHPYPAAPDDCEAVAKWLVDSAEEEFGAAPLLIGGESAGGHLAAVTLLRMRDRHDAVERFIGANLVFGVYDLTHPPTHRRNLAGADILTPESIQWFTEMFTPGMSADDRRAPDISPAFADVAGLPPALFTVGSADHLYDDTLLLAGHWAAAGNDTELLVYPEAPHGAMALPSIATHWFPKLLEFLGRCVQP